VYRDLKIADRPAVETCVNPLYRYRSPLDYAPEFRLTPHCRGILNPEEIRRSVKAGGSRVVHPRILERMAPTIWGHLYRTTEK
jgi:hypothetical protein